MLPFDPPESDNPLFREVRIARIQTETESVKTFELEPVGWDLVYRPGQFLTFVIPSSSGPVRRSYSLYSIPGEPPAVAVKRIPNGIFSRPMLEHAEIGDRLTVAGAASGFFTLPDDPEACDQLLFFAAGSGITPVFGMLKYLFRSGARVSTTLVYSNSRPETALFRQELKQLERDNKNLTIHWFFSNRQDLMRARLSKTTLEVLLSSILKGNPSRTHAFLCGPFDYMRMAAIVLQARGIPPENVRREIFTPELPKSNISPPDTGRHRVTIHFQGRVHQLEVQYPATILAAAKAIPLELPYSCESGRCGSCIAACTVGKVWMRYNEVLTDKEVDKGRILVCQSFPIEGDVTIVYE